MGEEGLKAGMVERKVTPRENTAITRQKAVEPIGAPPARSMWGQKKMGLLRARTKNIATRPMPYRPNALPVQCPTGQWLTIEICLAPL